MSGRGVEAILSLCMASHKRGDWPRLQRGAHARADWQRVVSQFVAGAQACCAPGHHTSIRSVLIISVVV